MSTIKTRMFSFRLPFKASLAKQHLGSSELAVKDMIEAVTGSPCTFDQVAVDGVQKYRLQSYSKRFIGPMATEEQFCQILQHLTLAGLLVGDANETVVTPENAKSASAEEFKTLMEDLMNGKRSSLRAWRELFLIEQDRRRKNKWYFVGGCAVLGAAVVGGTAAYKHFRKPANSEADTNGEPATDDYDTDEYDTDDDGALVDDVGGLEPAIQGFGF